MNSADDPSEADRGARLVHKLENDLSSLAIRVNLAIDGIERRGQLHDELLRSDIDTARRSIDAALDTARSIKDWILRTYPSPTEQGDGT